MSELWTPSDELLLADPVAASKVANPFSSPKLAEAGIILPELDEDDNEELAALALAELDGDEVLEGAVESGACNDDQEVDDDADTEPVGEDV